MSPEYLPFNEEPKWFLDLKENRKEYRQVSNIIENAKFKYSLEMDITKWIIGVGISLLLSPFSKTY